MGPRVAVLSIAAVNQPVYQHYIRTYWTELIRHTNESCPDIDVFLLTENGLRHDALDDLGDNVIEDPDPRYRERVRKQHRRPGGQGELS